jgi:1-acyl-sn-glycerol-3-phosphate acyltransferase
MSPPSLRDLGRAGLSAGRTTLTASRATTSAMVEDLVGSSGDDLLEARDEEFIRATLPAYAELIDLYFRPEVRGLEQIPGEGPVLIVGNHSGGFYIVDTFAFGYAFYSHFGPKRRFQPLSHDVAVKLPALSGLLRKYGGLPASTKWAERALERDAAVLVYPGGEVESFRPSRRSSEIDFAGRKGWIRLALSQEVPVVPVVAIGGQETALFVTRGRQLAKLLQLDRLARLKVFPIQIGPPFGVTVLDLPLRFPLPSKLTLQVMPPVNLHERFGPGPDEDEVYEAITEEMQAMLDELAAERDLPVIG